MILGVLLPLAAAALFTSVGLKPDLGALTVGILLSNHPKAEELSKSMLGFKDLFLVGFFLTIGLSGTPTLEMLGIALLLTLILPVKVALYFLILTRFRLRARTATMSSFSLTNYSEFGLIVGAAGLANGWLEQEWMIIFALALSITFVLASPLNIAANKIYMKTHNWLKRFETITRLPYEQPVDSADAEVIVLGMGRVGVSAYEVMEKRFPGKVLGIDYSQDLVDLRASQGHNIIRGDVTDTDFWDRVLPSPCIRLIMLTTAKHSIHMQVIKELGSFKDEIQIAAICRWKDEHKELKKAGVDIIFNLYSEAGAGYGEHTLEVFEQTTTT